MIGIDIQDNLIRIAAIHQRGSHFTLERVIESPVSAEEMADPGSLGRTLANLVEHHQLRARRAAITIPGRPAFIRRLPDNVVQSVCTDGAPLTSKATIDALLDAARRSLLVSPEHMVFDLWFGGDDSRASKDSPIPTVMLGAARKEEVDFYRQAIEQSGLKIYSLTSRPLAQINGLFFHWAEAKEDRFAVIYLEKDQGQIALTDNRGLITIQPIEITASANREIDCQSILEQYQRLVQVTGLSYGATPPERIFIAAPWESPKTLGTVAEAVQKKTGLPVTRCERFDGLNVDEGAGIAESPLRFVPAIGAALDGLEISPTWFNFLNPRSLRAEKKTRISWKPFALAGALVILILVGLWIHLVRQRSDQLQQLQKQLAEIEPQQTQTLEAKKYWNIFSGFVSPRKEGRRQQYLNILYEITRLFPETHDAYVTDMTISSLDRTGLTVSYDITINGKVRQGDILTTLIEELNKSELFQEAKQGTLTQDPADMLYPFNFSVTCNLKRTAVQEVKP